jgi:hypothetical protein
MKALTSPTVVCLGNFLGLLPLLVGFLLAVTATMGPMLIPHTSLCLMKITGESSPGVADEANAAYFGTWGELRPAVAGARLKGASGSCYRLAGGPLQCTPSAVNPWYNATIDAITTDGLPRIATQRIVHHLRQTPQVQITAVVLIFLSLLCFLPATLAARAPGFRFSPSRWLTLFKSKMLFAAGIFCLFWGFLLNLTASLAQKDQFGQSAGTYNMVLDVVRGTLPDIKFVHASTGSSFTQRRS